MKTEWDCEKCGIHIISMIPMPDETLYCLECRFVEGIEDPEAKQQAEEFLKRRDRSQNGAEGEGVSER